MFILSKTIKNSCGTFSQPLKTVALFQTWKQQTHSDGVGVGMHRGTWGPAKQSCSQTASLAVFLHVSFKTWALRDTWVARLVKGPTSAQVMTLRFVTSSPALGSVLTTQSLEPALDSVSPSLCELTLCVCLYFSLSKINTKKPQKPNPQP